MISRRETCETAAVKGHLNAQEALIAGGEVKGTKLQNLPEIETLTAANGPLEAN